jgi:hypothetical protein
MTTAESELPVPSDLDDDALELEALAIRRRRKLPMLTAALVLGVVAGGAFVGGVEAQKHLGSSGASANSGGASSFAARFGRGGAGAAATGAGNFTAGTVTAIKGSTLYITDASGNIVKVSTSAGSQVSKSVTGKVTDIRPGDTVVVRGTTGTNGTIAAESITLGGGGVVGGGGGGGFFGRGGGGSGAGNANGGATGFGGKAATP